MSRLINFLIPLIQILFVIATSAFVCLAYKHHSGNDRFLDYYQSKFDEREAKLITSRLFRAFPEIESVSALKSPDRDQMHLFEAKQKEKDPLKIARIRKELSCKDCRTVDFIVVLNAQDEIQLVKLMDPILVTGKAINTTEFLTQFKDKGIETPIQLGQNVENIKEAPESSEAIVRGITEVLDYIAQNS